MLAELKRAVESHAEVSEYVIAEVRRRTVVRTAAGVQRHHVVEGEASVYHDHTSGRGSAAVAVPVRRRTDVDEIIGRSVAHASRIAGPSWRLPPPAAPARVAVLDPKLAEDIDAAAADLAQRIARATGSGGEVAAAAGGPVDAGDLAITIDHRGKALLTSSGFRGRYESTLATVTLSLTARGDGSPRVARIELARRRLEDLALDDVLLAAAKRVDALARAKPTPPGSYELAIAGPALAAPPGGGFGWFAPLIAHADGATARHGLSRYLPGQSIFPGGESTGDPITIASDGALAFGTASEPFGRLGEPVRRFGLVERGIAAGLALDLREAGLRDVAPNGGVRNLVVEPGTLGADDELASGTAPLLHVVALRALDTDVRSGAFAAVVDLAYLDGEPVTGGLLRGNVYALLAGARLSRAVEFHGWYRGPRLIRTPPVDLF